MSNDEQVWARAGLEQAATRYARSAKEGDAEQGEAARRLGAARVRAMRAGMTFDETHMATHEAMHRAAGPCGPNSTCRNGTD